MIFKVPVCLHFARIEAHVSDIVIPVSFYHIALFRDFVKVNIFKLGWWKSGEHFFSLPTVVKQNKSSFIRWNKGMTKSTVGVFITCPKRLANMKFGLN